MGKVIKISAHQLEEIFKTKLVNSDTMMPTMYKYMRLSYVLEMVKNKEITFVSPQLWNDPFETKYLNTDYEAIGYKRPTQMYCFCARADNANEEASWNIYSHSQDDPLIRLSIKTFNLLEYLGNYAKQHNFQIYYSKTNYGMSTEEIASLYKSDNKYHSEYFDNFDEEKYIRLMSLKRKAFRYENEIRLFIVPEDGMPIDSNKLLRIPIDYDILTGYTFAPLERNEGDSIASKLKKIFYFAKLGVAKEEIKKYDSTTKFYRSRLYDETIAVDKITM